MTQLRNESHLEKEISYIITLDIIFKVGEVCDLIENSILLNYVTK